MLGFLSRRYINVGILSIILSCFFLTYALPVQAAPTQGFNQLAFMIRLEKLVEKMWKLEKSQDTKKMYSVALDVKTEVEGALGNSINVNKCMDQVEKELKKNGHQPPKKEFDSIRKALGEKDRKNKSHARYISSTMYLEGYTFNKYDEQAFNEVPYCSVKKPTNKDEDAEEQKEADVPAHLVFGVTLTLCGVFLMVLPIPGCKSWGENMLRAGILICGNTICNKTEENKKNQKVEDRFRRENNE